MQVADVVFFLEPTESVRGWQQVTTESHAGFRQEEVMGNKTPMC